jgi:hypothetical protein
MRRRAEMRVKRDDEIPPDPTETGTFALPSDIYSDEVGAAAAAATADTTAVYVSSGGGTVQLQTQVTDAPVATEVDPVAEGTVAATQSAEFAPYGNPTAMQGESALASYSVGTVSVDTAAPATPSADPTDTGSGKDEKSAAVRVVVAGWMGLVVGSLLVLGL